MKQKILGRQGDVGVIETTIPATAVAQPNTGTVTLAHGEATGHHHSIHSPRVTMFMDTGSGSGGPRVYMRVAPGEPVALVHQEHDPILFPAGDYEVRRQREYSPEAIRNVAD